MVADVAGDARNVCIVEGGIDLVEHEEGGGLVGVDGEEEGEGGHCFLAAGEVLHVAKAFEWGHGVVLEAGSVGFVGFFSVEVSVYMGEAILVFAYTQSMKEDGNRGQRRRRGS